ncbi:F4 family fimbrial subunit [Escherichia coli]|uniref:F4 family fimbrial subunit n=1 Tax=Escherichia coli TaxID=562 RepID=UPI0027E07B21|nr:fimbrial protein [Escherichia coli]
MKKTLIALAVATSAVSGIAHAWTSGDFNGSVDIGGDIIADNFGQKWEWAVGNSINGFNNKTTDLTEDGKKLTITVHGNKAILLGRTTEAFKTPTAGGWGAIPQIAFTDYEGGTVTLKTPAGVQNKGLVYFVLPMKNSAGTKVGTVKVNATFAGAAVEATGSNSGKLFSTYGGSAERIFNGGAPLYAELNSGIAAAEKTALFGSLSKADLVAQFQAVIPGATVTDGTNSEFASMNVLTSAAYALGIVDGQSMEATFDNAVTASTTWSAPLNMAISYN